MKIPNKRVKAGNTSIGTLIVFSLVIIISVSLVGLVSYFYMKSRSIAITKSILSDVNSTTGDIQKIKGLESCNASGIKYDAISNKYSLEGISDHTTGVCNLTSIPGVLTTSSSYTFSDKSTSSNPGTSTESCVYDECLSNGYYVIKSSNTTYPSGCNTAGLPDASNKCILMSVTSGIYLSPGSTETLGYNRNLANTFYACGNSYSTCTDIKNLSGATPSSTSDKYAVLYCNNLKNSVPTPAGTSQWYLIYENALREIAGSTVRNKQIGLPNASSPAYKTYWSSNFDYSNSSVMAYFYRLELKSTYDGISSTGNNSYNTSLYIRCIAK